MKIVFIGAGNLATNLAQEIHSKGHQILQIYSRTTDSAELLAQSVNSVPTTNLKEICQDADLYIFSVKDSALEGILNEMPATQGIWVHTAGSIPLSILEKYHDKYGVIYPFQTFSKNRKVSFQEISVFVEASDQSTFQSLQEFITTFSSRVIPLSSEKRKYVHLSGVFACNFVNHLYAIASEILDSQDIPMDVLLPLIDETARKVHELNPKEAQTGPAVRYDENVIQKHLSLLTDADERQIYELMSKNIYKTNQ